jgi:hypothetical protein
MKYAWIENDKVRDVCHGDPTECYHPDVAKFYNTEVPDGAVNGDGWVDGQLVKPEPPPPAPPPPRTWSVNDIRTGMKLSERVKWDNDSAPEIVTAKTELQRPLELDDVTEVLDMLLDAALISATTKTKVLA